MTAPISKNDSLVNYEIEQIIKQSSENKTENLYNRKICQCFLCKIVYFFHREPLPKKLLLPIDPPANIELRADPVPLPEIVRPKKVDDKRKKALPENQENREILLIIQNNYLKTSVQRIEEEFKRGLHNVNIRIFQENQLMDDLLPKVPFLAFNIIFNGGCPNLPKINSKQSEVFRLCKENCVIVLLSRSKNQNVEKIIQTGISSKDGIKRYAISWQMNRSVGDQMSESAVKHLSEQMRNIFNDYLRFKK